MMKQVFQLLCLTLFFTVLHAHGRMTLPNTRVDNPSKYENDPVGFDVGQAAIGNQLTDWICRHEEPLADLTPWTAGDIVELGFNFGVNHPGFCDGMISYDYGLPREEMKWFKIANFLDCGSKSTDYIVLPDWLAAGPATFRWSWTALHLFPQPEFFTQCADVYITSPFDQLPTNVELFSILNPLLYPRHGTDGVGYADPYNGGNQDWVTGPACANGFMENECELTLPGTLGHIDPFGLDPATDSTGSGPTENPSTMTSTDLVCTSIDSQATDIWCQETCEWDMEYCMSTGFCSCSGKDSTTTSMDPNPDSPDTDAPVFSGKINLIGYYGNSGGCVLQGCTPTFSEIHEAYNVIIVTFLNFDSAHELNFEISSLAPVQESNLAPSAAAWKSTSDVWGRKKLVLASLGGQNGQWPSDISDDDVFAKLDAFLTKHNLDGIDIDLEASSIAGVEANINAFLRLQAKGYVLSAAPEAAQGPLTAYQPILKDLNWVHPQFYNNPPNAVTVPFVPFYSNPGDWQMPKDEPWWLVTMDTTAQLEGLSPEQRGIAVPATPSAAGNNNNWDLELLAEQVRAGGIMNVATWALGYDKQNDWGLAKEILPLLGGPTTLTSTTECTWASTGVHPGYTDSWCETNCDVDPVYMSPACSSDNGAAYCSCADSTGTTGPSTARPTSTPADMPVENPPTTEMPVETITESSGGDQVRLCYFTNWARYRTGLINEGKDVFEMGFDPNLCTHVNYGFVIIDSTFALQAHDPYADHPNGDSNQNTLCPDICKPGYVHDWSQGPDPCQYPCNPDRVLRGFEGLTVGLKRKNPNLKAIASAGGWNFNDCSYHDPWGHQGAQSCHIFSTIAADETLTKQHAQDVIAFLRNWRFDGFDVDWEYPVVAGHNDVSMQETPQDYDNYIRYLRLLREAFEQEAQDTGNERLLLTAAVGVGKPTVEVAYNIPAMNDQLDLMSLMTYDLHGGWESLTGFNAPLYSTAEDIATYTYDVSVSWAVDYWLSHGASADKLVMGLGTYGRGWVLADMTKTTPLSNTLGKAPASECTGEAGYAAYYEILDMIQKGGAERHYDSDREAPYIVTPDGHWYGYDDEVSFAKKLEFMKTRGLRGAMVWAIDLDDFDGNQYPLLNLVKDNLADYREFGTETPQDSTKPPDVNSPTQIPTTLGDCVVCAQTVPSCASGCTNCFVEPQSCYFCSTASCIDVVTDDDTESTLIVQETTFGSSTMEPTGESSTGVPSGDCTAYVSISGAFSDAECDVSCKATDFCPERHCKCEDETYDTFDTDGYLHFNLLFIGLTALFTL